MAMPNNVFRGSNSVADFFDVDKNPLLPLVEIPDRLNPYRNDNVRIYAKMLTYLPAQNVKSLPALHMLRQEPRAQHRTIAEASSGSTILSLGILARVLWGNEDVVAHVTNKKSPESLNLLRFFGIKPSLFPGLAQQEPTDPTGIMERLRQKALNSYEMVYLGQYDNANNWKAHAMWTGPQILKQLPEVSLFSTTVGTGGCITGTGVALKAEKPSTRILGVFNVAGDPVPGPRYYEGFQSSPFPWQETIDARIEVTSASAYLMSMKLSREGLISGPSSGEALQGLLQYLAELKDTGRLDELVDKKTGEISCVFTCSDLPYQYLPGYFDKLDADEFPVIENEILLQCDQAKHDLRWILDGQQAFKLLEEDYSAFGVATFDPASSDESFDIMNEKPVSTAETGLFSRFLRRLCGALRTPRERVAKQVAQHDHRQSPLHPSTIVIDLRSSADFGANHAPASFSRPLPGLHENSAGGDLFGNPDAVYSACGDLQKWLQSSQVINLLDDAAKNKRRTLIVCYDGFFSQLACSLFRARDIEAYSVHGGIRTLLEYMTLEGRKRLR